LAPEVGRWSIRGRPAGVKQSPAACAVADSASALGLGLEAGLHSRRPVLDSFDSPAGLTSAAAQTRTPDPARLPPAPAPPGRPASLL